LSLPTHVSSHYKEIVCGVLSIAQKSGPPLGIFPQPIIRKPCLLTNGKYFSLNTSTSQGRASESARKSRGSSSVPPILRFCFVRSIQTARRGQCGPRPDR